MALIFIIGIIFAFLWFLSTSKAQGTFKGQGWRMEQGVATIGANLAKEPAIDLVVKHLLSSGYQVSSIDRISGIISASPIRFPRNVSIVIFQETYGVSLRVSSTSKELAAGMQSSGKLSKALADQINNVDATTDVSKLIVRALGAKLVS
ncbi:hypothetical protein EON81_18715 [bacterium]|nr:MAG: hypothetical protein EON81_18715 [bacterium]